MCVVWLLSCVAMCLGLGCVCLFDGGVLIGLVWLVVVLTSRLLEVLTAWRVCRIVDPSRCRWLV